MDFTNLGSERLIVPKLYYKEYLVTTDCNLCNSRISFQLEILCNSIS